MSLGSTSCAKPKNCTSYKSPAKQCFHSNLSCSFSFLVASPPSLHLFRKNDCYQNTPAGNLINYNFVIVGDSRWGSNVHVSKRHSRPRVPNIIFTEGRSQRQEKPHQHMAECPEGILLERNPFLWLIFISMFSSSSRGTRSP